jgi:hypothetical protein
MKKLQDIAELLVASWVLSREGDPIDPLPTSHGLLDRALNKALKEGAFPTEWRERLHFVDSRIGLQCVELDAVIGTAQRAEFTTEPNPSYETTHIKISANAARALLHRNRVNEDDAKKWGSALHEAVTAAKTALQDFPGR